MTAPFDFRNPQYLPVYQQRVDRLRYLREHPERVPKILAYYRDNPWDFMNDWGTTFDPRNADIDQPTVMPFVLFPKQIEWVKWAYTLWKSRKDGITEKSRDCGVSWLSVGLGVSIGLTHDTVNIGYGSRKQEYVDKKGAPKALFWKAREYIKRLPPELTGHWNEKTDSIENLIRMHTGSTLSGEVGDSIGRGDRAAFYIVDEAAHLEHPETVDQGLSATTNCRIDVSSANGTNNPFYDKVQRFPKDQIFTFHWRDDPRKDQAWYDNECARLDPITVAQEIDINYSASQTGVIIPPEWVKAAIDADTRFLIAAGLKFSGKRRGALDVADEGPDLNAFAWAQGVIVEGAEEWSGKGSDPFATVQRTFMTCDEYALESFHYDADGIGANVRGDARVINSERIAGKVREIVVAPFRGSGEVFKPNDPVPTAFKGGSARNAMDRKNGDFFYNAKAQSWWDLRIRFQRTFRAVEAAKRGERIEYDADDLIVLRSTITDLGKLERELSQPTYTQTTGGKILVDKAPKDPSTGRARKSPNKGDSVMILMAPRKTSFLSYLD